MESKDVLQETALIYLSDALLRQAYEECQTIIKTAKKLGVLEGDIDETITDYLAGRRIKGRNEAGLNDGRLGVRKGG